MPRLEIALLGPPRILLDGVPVATDRRKAIALLACLAVEPVPQSRERLAALLWPDYPQDSAHAYLRRTLWELNQVLGKGWIEAGREHAALLRSPDLWLDVDIFTAAAATPAALEGAAGLYRGEFLEGLVVADTPSFETWQREQAGHFQRRFAGLLADLAAAHQAAGRFDLALSYARRWQALDPLDEAAGRAVLRALGGLGDRAGAAHAYQSLAQTLQNELGLDPQPETSAAYQAALQGSAATPAAPAAPPPAARPAGNLPVPPTAFIGRRAEVEQIAALALEPATRLLTLQGPGGAGKTRLSIQAATEIAAKGAAPFPDGIWFIPLAPLISLQGIIAAAAKALPVTFYREDDSPRQQLIDYLREKRLLLVLDNFEHLVEEGAPLVAEILAAAPGVKVLATSRVRLNLQGEQVYRVAGMRVPDPAEMAAWDDPAEQSRPFSAVQLLLDRARRVRPDFQLTRQNLPAVVEICRLVDGSPLGIELAVTWLELLPPEEIAGEIARSLDFLESSAPDLPPRQRSLRAVFETSWNLLEPAEQRAFQRLCIFHGSFTRPAALAVSAADLRTLLGLSNKSWLALAENGRIQVHELLRQYGLERLQADPQELQAGRERMAAYFAAFMLEQGQALQTASQVQALNAIHAEMESNLPSAWDWLVARGRFDILVEKMLPGLFHFWLVRGHFVEMIERLKAARMAAGTGSGRRDLLHRTILETVETSFETGWALLEDRPSERLERLWQQVHAGNMAAEMGFWYVVLAATYRGALNYEEGSRRLQEILPAMEPGANPWNRAYGYLLLSEYQGRADHAAAARLLKEAQAIFEQIGVVHEQGVTLVRLGLLASTLQDYRQAIEYCQAAQNKMEQAGDFLSMGLLWTDLAEYYMHLGDIESGFREYERARHFHEKNGNRRWLGQVLSWESIAAGRYGRLDYALETRLRSLEIAREVGNQSDIAWHTWELGETYRLTGDMEQALVYYDLALPMFEQFQAEYGIAFVHRGRADVAAARHEYEAARNECHLALKHLEREQRIMRIWAFAYTHSRLGTLLVELGELPAAQNQLQTALEYAFEWVHADIKAVPLAGIAALHVARGQFVEAVELAACVVKAPTTWNETRMQAAVTLETAARGLPPAEAGQARRRGEAASIDEMAQRCRAAA